MMNKLLNTITLTVFILAGFGCPTDYRAIEDPAAEEQPFPTTDAEGADLTGVPRYPDSVRVDYQSSDRNEQETVVYVTRDDEDKIEEFYQHFLRDDNWQNIRSYATPAPVRAAFEKRGSIQISAVKENRTLSLEAHPSPIYSQAMEITLSLGSRNP